MLPIWHITVCYSMPYTNHPSTAPSSIHITARNDYMKTSHRHKSAYIHEYARVQLFGVGRAIGMKRICLKEAHVLSLSKLWGPQGLLYLLSMG